MLASLAAMSAQAATHTLIVSGLGGEPQYEQRFAQQAEEIAAVARSLAEDPAHVVKLSGEQATREAIRRELKALVERVGEDDTVTIVLIGHGTYDGEEYRFNLPGPDLTASELGALFDQLPARDQLIVNSTSASGAAIERWKRDNRVVITSTKSGGERTATRFAQYWAEALKGGDADTNKDDIVTASEAFEYASRQVEAAFKADVALATEHARMEGGEIAGALTVARLGRAAIPATDPEVRALLAQRAALEKDLEAVKQQRAALDENAYYDALEDVLVKFARLQREIDAKQGIDPTSPQVSP